MKRIVEKVVRAPQTIPEATEVVINNPDFIAPTAALVKLEQRNYTEKRAKIDERGRQCVKSRISLDPVATSNPSKIGENLRKISLTISKRARGRTRWQRRTVIATTIGKETRNRYTMTRSDMKQTRLATRTVSSNCRMFQI